MPVYDKDEVRFSKRPTVRFQTIHKKRKLNPTTGKLEVDENWKPQTLRAAPKGVGKKNRNRPPKQKKQQQIAV